MNTSSAAPPSSGSEDVIDLTRDHPDPSDGRTTIRDELIHHLADTHLALRSIGTSLDVLERWTGHLVGSLEQGGRLLVAGNGGSAAHAQHLSSELVGRFRDDRIPYSAIALTAEPSVLTGILDDYGADHVFSRQVQAHARRGDSLALFSSSGRSPNVLRAAEVAGRIGLHTLAVTGPAPNPLTDRCREVVAIDSSSASAVEEAHQVVVHMICVAFERRVGQRSQRVPEPPGPEAAWLTRG